jgi:hypothetical protein
MTEPLIVDGHVHITNRVYWEGLNPWQPQPFGFDRLTDALPPLATASASVDSGSIAGLVPVDPPSAEA